MKKRVRIYKAGGEQGQYMNKTAQFLMKAQLGAERTEDEKITDSVTRALSQGMSPEAVLANLTQMGVDEQTAIALIQSVMQSMQPEEEQTEEVQSPEEEVAEEQPMAQEGQEVVNPVLAQYDSVAQRQEPTEEAEDTEEDDSAYYTPESQFPGIEQYMPEYTPVAGDLEVYDINNPFADMLYSKNGGPVSKRNFVKNVMTLVKKENGGDTQKNKADKTDIPVGGRSEKLQNFLGAIKSTAQDAVMKQAVNNMYDDMMQMGGFTDQASGMTMFQGGGEDDAPLDISYTDSKNTTDPYFKYGGLPKAQYGPQNWNEVDDNKNGIPDYLEVNYLNQSVKKDTPAAKNQGYNINNYSTFIDPTKANRASFNPFGQIFNYEQSWLKPVGGPGNFNRIQFDPNAMGKPTNVELRRSGKLKEMDMVFDPNDKSNITSITDMKFRRSGMPKSFTINYTNPSSTGANPAFDFMLSKYTASKAKQNEPVKSNGAPTGPRVSESADMYDGLNVRQAKRLARDFETPDRTWKDDIQFQIPNQPIDDSGFAPPVDWHDAIKFQTPTEPIDDSQFPVPNKGNGKGQAPINTSGPTVDQEYMYGGNYAYGGNLPEYQGNVTDTKASTVGADPKMQPVVDNSTLKGEASAAINKMSNFNKTDDVDRLEPKRLTEDEQMQIVNATYGYNPLRPEYASQSQKVKVKNQYSIDPEAALNTFNAGARGLAGFIDNTRTAQKQNQYMQNNMNSDALFAANEHTNRGTYDTNSGLFRPDEMGFTGVVKYGGPIYAEGGEAYMTDEEIEDFLANGGKLEYIND